MYIGIVTIGSAPFFYKITITQALVDMVMKSQCPAQETIFERFIPPVKDVDDFVRDGMLTLDNRRVCFQCYEALRVSSDSFTAVYLLYTLFHPPFE